jgi:hypothetical protein
VPCVFLELGANGRHIKVLMKSGFGSEDECNAEATRRVNVKYREDE